MTVLIALLDILNKPARPYEERDDCSTYRSQQDRENNDDGKLFGSLLNMIKWLHILEGPPKKKPSNDCAGVCAEISKDRSEIHRVASLKEASAA